MQFLISFLNQFGNMLTEIKFFYPQTHPEVSLYEKIVLYRIPGLVKCFHCLQQLNDICHHLISFHFL